MCGFAGLIIKSRTNASLEYLVQLMIGKIEHRGPDDSGIWIDTNIGFGMGHQRLAILDTSKAGHQPMTSESKRYILSFNGEIYNHLELRKRLSKESMSPPWRGTSDTETFLAAVDAWGIKETLNLSVGMFSFGIWDKRNSVLTLARDRFGEKPLYYGITGEGEKKAFVFGSELSALKAYLGFNNNIEKKSLIQYLRFSAISAPNSIYKDIYKLEPGHMLKVQLPFEGIIQKSEAWWSLDSIINKDSNYSKYSEMDYIEELEKVLTKAVERQSLSDVPLGTFLSGGIDSSLITALLNKKSSKTIETFTIGFEDQSFNEAPYASAIAKHLGTNHNETIISSSDIINVIPKLPKIYSEPFADSSQLPTYVVCREARINGLKVALSGDGGDELFGGYNRYFWSPNIWEKISWMPFNVRRTIGKMNLMIPAETWESLKMGIKVQRFGQKVHKMSERMKYVKSIDELYLSLISEWNNPMSLIHNDAKEIIGMEYSFINDIPSDIKEDQALIMMYKDTLGYLPNDILTKVDRASMSVGLETRAPFLDHEVAEIAWQLPTNMKIRKNRDKQLIGKWALRKILNKYLPIEMIDRPKTGFGIPIGDWLRGPLKTWMMDLLDPKVIKRQNLINSKIVEQILREHVSGKFDHTGRLWSLLMWQAWLEEWE